jgi:hypothetical protein
VAAKVACTLSRRMGLRKCLSLSVDLQMILLRLFCDAEFEASSLLSLMPPDSKLTPDIIALKAKVIKNSDSSSFAIDWITPKGNIKQISSSSSWWLANNNNSNVVEVKVTKKQELVLSNGVGSFSSVIDWNNHTGVMADVASANKPPQIPRSLSSSSSSSFSVRDCARNAVLCIINNSPLSSLACRVLLRFPPDSAAATTLMQFAASRKPVLMNAILVSCKEGFIFCVLCCFDALTSLLQRVHNHWMLLWNLLLQCLFLSVLRMKRE